MADSQELSFFFCRVNSSAFEKKLEIAVELLNTADYVIFVAWAPPEAWPDTAPDTFLT